MAMRSFLSFLALMIGLLNSLQALAQTLQTAADHTKRDPITRELAAQLPAVDCKSVQIVWFVDGQTNRITPDRALCESTINRLKAGSSNFWPPVNNEIDFDRSYKSASDLAADFCGQLLKDNGVDTHTSSEVGCILDLPLKTQPIGELVHHYFMEQALPEAFRFGSVCIDLPIDRAEAKRQSPVPPKLLELFSDGSDWNAIELQLSKEGFTASMEPKGGRTKYAWVVIMDQNGNGGIYFPSWFTIYEGEKRIYHPRKYGCVDRACEEALERYKKLRPEKGLCFEQDYLAP